MYYKIRIIYLVKGSFAWVVKEHELDEGKEGTVIAPEFSPTGSYILNAMRNKN